MDETMCIENIHLYLIDLLTSDERQNVLLAFLVLHHASALKQGNMIEGISVVMSIALTLDLYPTRHILRFCLKTYLKCLTISVKRTLIVPCSTTFLLVISSTRVNATAFRKLLVK